MTKFATTVALKLNSVAGVFDRWQGPWTICAAWLGLLLATVTPPHGTGVTICWFKQATGIDCIGCGLTRSLSCGLRGMFAESLKYHPFGLFILALFIFTAVFSVLPPARRRLAGFMEARPMWFNGFYLAFVVTFVGFGTIRSLIELMQRVGF
jgi:hypothetical protein